MSNHHKMRLTKSEEQDYRVRLLLLEELGIPIGSAPDPAPEPDRLIIEQIDREFARLYELPSGEIALVATARMTIRTSGILITHREITTSLDDYPLELSDPTGWKYYQDVIDSLPYSPKNLSRWLTSSLPLRPCQVQGVIIANGWTRVPPECRDETTVRMELFIRDERSNEIGTEFELRLDRSLKRRYESRRQRQGTTLLNRAGLYAGGPLGDQNRVSPLETIKPRQPIADDDAELQEPN